MLVAWWVEGDGGSPPRLGPAGARLERSVGLGLRERKLFFVLIILRDKDVFSLAAIIFKKFCDKKIQLFLLLKTSRMRRATRKKPLGLIIVSASAVSMRFLP